MLFNTLKLFGLDVPAKVDAAKAVIEQRVEEVADRAKHLALSSAVIVALSTFAALYCTMAIGVGLFALYRTETAMYGVDIALAVVAAVLVIAALVLIGVAVMIGKSLSRAGESRPADDVAKSVAAASAFGSADQAQIYSPAPSATPTDSASDLIEPLAFLLGKYVRYPSLGHPALDDLIGKLRVSARGTADEAVERAANLMRHGDRSQLLVLLGGAAFVGWLLARQSPEERLHDATPAG
jgi:hypothetical protein